MRPAEFVLPPAVPARETFSVGAALSRSAGVWAKNLPFFVGVSFVAYLPLLFLSPGVPTGWAGFGLWFLGMVLSGILGYVATGFVTYSVLEQLRGRVPTIRESVARGWARAGPLFAAAFLTGILLLGAALALIIPAIVLGVRWALLAPVVVAEEVIDPRERSSELTAGHRWGIFGVMLLFFMASATIGAILGAVVGPATSFVPRLIVQIVPSAVTLSFSAVIYTVIYYQLRSEKEGIDLEQLTAVFR